MQRKQIIPVNPLPENLPLEYSDPNSLFEEEGHTESTLYDYWRVVFKYRFLILSSCVLLGLLSVFAAFMMTPQYTATSKIRIGTYEPVLTAASVEGVYQEQSKEAYYLETQIREISSITMADRVLSAPKVLKQFEKPKQPGFFSMLFGMSSDSDVELAGSAYRHPLALIERYNGALSVSPVRRTSLVEISFTDPSPQTAANLANQHAIEYRNWVRESRVEQRSNTLRFLREQSEDLRQKVATLEREIADYAEEHSIVAVNSDQNITAQRMAQLNTLLTDVTAKKIEAEKQYEKSKDALTKNAAAYDDATTQRMRTELAKLQGEYGQLSEKFTPEYPKLRQLKAQMDSIQISIREQREQIISGYKSKADAYELEEARLREELDQQKSMTFELAKRQVQYNVLNRELESSRELLQNVLRQTKESALAIEGNSSNVTIVDYAVVPIAPSAPKKGLMVVGGMSLGLIVGVLFAFLLHHLDNTIHNPEVLSKLTSLPHLGVVPSFDSDDGPPNAQDNKLLHMDSDTSSSNDNSGSKTVEISEDDSYSPMVAEDGEGELKNPPVAFLTAPNSLAAEAYRTIRTAILLSQAGDPPRTILVTSAQSGEGKTTSSINVAASLSSAGGKVLIVDCDLRRPSVQKYFEIEGVSSGVVEVLTNSAQLSDVVIEGVAPRISILPSGRIPPNPAELIGSEEMRQLVQDLAASYDFVIFDSPPVLPVTDSVILSRYVDGVVMVIKGGVTPKRVVVDAKERLASIGAHFLGTILNDIDLQSSDYYYYNRYYSSYYSEYDEEGEPTDRRAAG